METGLDWARDHATWSDLRFIALFAGRRKFLVSLKGLHSITSYLFHRAVDLGYDPEPDWFDDLDDSPFNRGLARGAAEVYSAAKDLVPEPAD